MLRSVLASTLSLGLIAAPAGASIDGAAAPGTKAQAQQKRYCLQFDNAVGTRISRTECKTKAQWAREGIEIDKLSKQ